MANKTGMAFDPEQVQELSSALKAIANVTKTALGDADKVFAQLLGEEVIGESAQKAPITEAINDTKLSFVNANDKIDRMNDVVNEICEKLGIATSTNIRTTEDASAAIHAQAVKVREATESKGAKA